MNNKGQVILLLILVMTVALAIGLSVVQKSLVDVSTASKVEQSSRAFSAAEAGIEKTLLYPTGSCGAACNINFSDNSSTATVSDVPSKPAPALSGHQQEALEFPPLAKEDVAQVWLADYTSSTNPPPTFYTRNSLDVYWGNSSTDKAALEITLIYFGADPNDIDIPQRLVEKYRSKKWYLDNQAVVRTPVNQFETVTCSGYVVGVNTYQCKKTLAFTSQQTTGQMLIRARLLYNATSQPFAVQAVGNCPSSGPSCNNYSLPAQARTIISTGISGETQRKIKVFQLYKVVPPYFDYAIFSAGDISK